MIRASFILLACMTVRLAAQTSGPADTSRLLPDRPMIIKTDVVAPFFYESSIDDTHFFGKTGSVTFECLIGKQLGVQVSVLGFQKKWDVTDWPYGTNHTWTANGVRILPEGKFYVSGKKRNSGYFIGAFGYYDFSKESGDYLEGEWSPAPGTLRHHWDRVRSAGIGITNGCQFYLWKRLSLEAIVRLNISRYSYVWTGSNFHNSQLNFLELMVFPAINIGYRFDVRSKKSGSGN